MKGKNLETVISPRLSIDQSLNEIEILPLASLSH